MLKYFEKTNIPTNTRLKKHKCVTFSITDKVTIVARVKRDFVKRKFVFEEQLGNAPLSFC